MRGSRFKIFGPFLVPALLVAGIATTFSSTSANGGDDEFNRPGNTLIADQFNNRVNTDPKSNPRCINGTCTGPLPTRALRLKNGDTLISDQYNHRVIEVSPDKQIVRTFGKIATLGYNIHSVAHDGLNSPYDAKRIGDYTGITPPFDNDD